MVQLIDSGVSPVADPSSAILSRLRVRLFADGADKMGMLEMYEKPYISGFTTNPTLMRKAGVTDYRAFALDVVAAIPDRPISFEVFADEPREMERQARQIASWGDNVYVKIPVMNTSGDSMLELVRHLSASGVKVNVTAMMTIDQVEQVADAVSSGTPCIVSMFAGRIADTGRDPLPIMSAAVQVLSTCANAELLWASPREVLNIFHAEAIGCHIITVTNDVLKKLDLLGKDLSVYSLETVRMFFQDAAAAGYRL